MTTANSNNNNSNVDDGKAKASREFKAKTTVWDYPRILYGGVMEYKISYGDVTQIETHTFRNAFKEALSYDKIKRAADQCGYYPVTKKLLQSDRLRCEIIESNNDTKDTRTIIAEEIEKMNKEAITFLTNLGMDDIHKLRRTINKITTAQQEARINITEPHTFDRIQKIMKAKTAGDYFRAGGGAYNCDDAMVAMQIIKLETRKKMLEKKKTKNSDRQKQILDGEAANKIAVKDLKIDDYKKLIKWKKPDQAVTGKDKVTGKGVNKDHLIAIWNTVKHLVPPGFDDIPDWKEKDQQQLDDLKVDGRKDLHRMYVFRRPLQRKMVTLTSQVGSMLPKHRIKIVGSILQELDNNDREEILSNWKKHDIDDDFSLSETSSISSCEGMNTVRRRRPKPQPQPQQQPEPPQHDKESALFVNDDDDDDEEELEEEEEEEDDEEKDSDISSKEEIVRI